MNECMRECEDVAPQEVVRREVDGGASPLRSAWPVLAAHTFNTIPWQRSSAATHARRGVQVVVEKRRGFAVHSNDRLKIVGPTTIDRMWVLVLVVCSSCRKGQILREKRNI